MRNPQKPLYIVVGEQGKIDISGRASS